MSSRDSSPAHGWVTGSERPKYPLELNRIDDRYGNFLETATRTKLPQRPADDRRKPVVMA